MWVKCLMLGYHDGRSFFALDFSLHGEKGDEKKKNYKPYGLTQKQLKARFSKNRNAQSAGKQREKEYFHSKIETLISMVKTAVSQGIRFDYLLVDSWFCCHEIVKFIATGKIECHFLGMVKRGTTQYLFRGKSMNFNRLLKFFQRTKMQRCRKQHCHFYETSVDFKGITVKIFFCKMGKNGVWHGLLTTDLKLSFEKVFEIYATRWTIEVFFKDSK